MKYSGEKNLFSLILKIVIVTVLVFLQLLVFIVIFNATKNFSLVVSSLFVLVELIAILYVVYRDLNPAYKIIWIILILSVPIFGIVLYFLAGSSKFPKRFKRLVNSVYKTTDKYLVRNDETYSGLNLLSDDAYKQANYLWNTSSYPLYKNDSAEYLPLGEIYYEKMCEDIKKAEKYIFIEYFIISRGKAWDRLVKLLKEKAKGGVKIYISTDGIGSVFKLPRGFKSLDQEKNIYINIFNPVTPIISFRLNNRNHRKITIIDGKVAYTGGINIGDEYINLINKFGHWKDFGIRITGESVRSFVIMFVRTWNFGVKKMKITDDLFTSNLKRRNDGYIVPYSDGPINNNNPAENTYMNMINSAKKYIYVTTPYLILDNELQQAFINAARSGIDVRIIVPGIPDKKTVHACGKSFYGKLLSAGVKIYEYTPGFIHGKMCICDDVYGVIGSVNFDFRSLYLHYECAVWLYKAKAIFDMKEDYLKMISVSKEVSLKELNQRSIFRKMGSAILKIFAPLL